MSFQVKKAQRQRRPLKVSLEGLSGSGKTYTALRLAFALKRAGVGKKIVVADSENESAGLYDGIVSDGEKWEYDVCAIPPAKQNPDGYADVYEYLLSQGYDLIIVDSMSHAWHGAMEQVDSYAQRNKGDKFGGWAKVTPSQRRMLSLLTDTRAHLIATMRVKGEYERVEGANGRDRIKKVGMKVDQREGTEYEFDCVVRLDPENHEARVEKVRGCTAMDGRIGNNPGPDFWKPLIDWWKTGADYTPEPVKIRDAAQKWVDALKECTNQDELAAVKAAMTPAAMKPLNLSADEARLIRETHDSLFASLPAAREAGDESEDGTMFPDDEPADMTAIAK